MKKSTVHKNYAQISGNYQFKILLYADMNDISSSRQIELACKRYINFMWLLQGYKVPDHNTISRFRSERLNTVLDDLFYQFILKLYEIGEIEFENVFIDGTKIEDNANKYTFVWKKSVNKNELKLQEKITSLLKVISERYNYNILNDENISKVELINHILIFFTDLKVSSNIEFVYGNRKENRN